MNNKPVIILGGGLWGGLLAYRWQQLHPEVEFLLVEAQGRFGGEHTWCFHENDVSVKAKNWLKPFIVQSWEGYSVKFPTYERTISSSYHALNSTQFDHVLSSTLPDNRYSLLTKLNLEEAIALGAWVIDARGTFDSAKVAYQKFLGIELELESPHHLKEPILMDVKVPQVDGFRFMYALPFGPDRVLIEDTRYSISSHLNDQELKAAILKYAEGKNWKVKRILRQERGMLPLPLTEVKHTSSEAVNLGGIFHDTTGYSLPDAVRLIDLLLQQTPSKTNFERVVENYRKLRSPDRRFFRLLNRFMFRASGDNERYRMLQFFYRHSPKLISQFYSGKLSSFEKIRFFIGRPPVSILKAFREVME